MFLRLLYSFALAAIVVPAANAMPIDSLVARVFPFKAGQEYEFKSVFQFRNLPPYTEVEFTITDTVINGVTWLRIPYWSPFGCGLYRLDESYRIIMYGGSGTLFDLRTFSDAFTNPRVSRGADWVDVPCWAYNTYGGGAFDIGDPTKHTRKIYVLRP